MDNSGDLDCQALTEKLEVLWFPAKPPSGLCYSERSDGGDVICLKCFAWDG